MAFLDLIIVFLTALGLTVIFVPLLLRFAHSKEIYDLPDSTQENGRRIHIKPIPRLGGIAIVSAFFLSLLIWKVPVHSRIIYCGSLVLFFMGLFDDLKNLSAKLRLTIQICAAVFTVFFANLSLKSLVISQNIILPIPNILGFCLAVFIIIGAINAMNMIDGLDGLASGVALIGISILSYFLFLNARKHELLLLFTVPMLGSIVGFLKYNTYPSTIFMGDSGSNWLGFMVGAFILTVANTTPVIPLMSILLAFSIPIFDTAHVIVLRLKEGKNPMIADNRHFHHSLIKLGFTHSQSVGIIYFLMFFFGVIGMIPVAFPQYTLWWVSWFGVVLLVCFLVLSIQIKKDTKKDTFVKNTLFKIIIFYQKYSIKRPISTFVGFIESIQRYTIYCLLFTTPLLIVSKPTFISVMTALSCYAMGVMLFMKKTCSFLFANIIVIIISMLFLMSNIDEIKIEFFTLNFNLQTIYHFIFVWLFISTIFFCGITLRRKFFIITPTDILLVLIPLLILMMPDTWHNGYGLRLIVVRSLVLFAALRMFGKTIHAPATTAQLLHNSECIPKIV